jgi:hypothetical protein
MAKHMKLLTLLASTLFFLSSTAIAQDHETLHRDFLNGAYANCAAYLTITEDPRLYELVYFWVGDGYTEQEMYAALDEVKAKLVALDPQDAKGLQLWFENTQAACLIFNIKPIVE